MDKFFPWLVNTIGVLVIAVLVNQGLKSAGIEVDVNTPYILFIMIKVANMK